MSYEIVYDRQFIKTPSGYTSVILCGSNNCYEPTYKNRSSWRRERNWCILFDRANLPEAELLERVERSCGGKYQQHFKFRGKWVDDEGYRRFVKNGIKNAHTIEEYTRVNQFVTCSISIWRDKRDYNDPLYNTVELNRTVYTTEEFGQWVKDAEERFSELDADKTESYVYYCKIHFPNNEPIFMPTSNTKEIQGEVCVKYKRRGYVTELKHNGITYTKDASKALFFKDAEQALDALKVAGSFANDCDLVRADTVRTRAVASFVIKVNGGEYDRRYIYKLTSRRLRFAFHADGAKKFISEKEAERYIRTKLEPRFSLPGYEVCNINKEMA